MSRKSKAAEFASAGYDVQVTGRHVAITEAMKAHAIEKISKIDRKFERIVDVHITMDIQKLDHKVDIVAKIENVKIKSSAITTDMYASIDIACNKLQTQLRKYHEKIRDHHAKATKTIDLNVNIVEPHRFDEIKEVNEEIEEENSHSMVRAFRPHALVSKEKKTIKTLSTEEAIMHMELSQDVFLIYRAEEDLNLKVIYRRKDGMYGLIELQNLPT